MSLSSNATISHYRIISKIGAGGMGEVYLAQALGDSLAIYDWNWAESEREFKKSFELDPNISYTHVAYALAHVSVTGNADRARE